MAAKGNESVFLCECTRTYIYKYIWNICGCVGVQKIASPQRLQLNTCTSTRLKHLHCSSLLLLLLLLVKMAGYQFALCTLWYNCKCSWARQVTFLLQRRSCEKQSKRSTFFAHCKYFFCTYAMSLSSEALLICTEMAF